MLNLKLALLSTVCVLPLLTLSASPALAAKAGVTAAVNPQAVGTPPGGGVRTIVLGQDVVTNEKIDTTGGGLVQILLADGTTFTVGPNSSLTIDKFVYDPDANTAQVTASLAKGVFRFIGGRTSKTDGGVTINTPVGTVGIRGAVADISLTPNGQTLKAQIDLLFGKEVTLSGPGGLIDRIYKAGYSIIIGLDGKARLVPTPPGSAGSIQQALAGKPGTHGGTGDPPGDGDVKDSGVPGTNSDKGLPGYTPPDLEAIELATIDFFNGHDDAKDILGDQPAPTGGFGAGYITEAVDLSDGAVALTSGDDPANTTIGLPSNSLTMTGHVPLEEWGADLTLGFDGTGTASLAFYGPLTVTSVHNTKTTEHSAELCTNCQFMQWGYWNSQFNVVNEYSTYPVTASGTWITGKITSDQAYDQYADAYPAGMDATYTGKANGLVYNGSGASYAASGDMSLTYNLGYRTGGMEVTDFDGHDFSIDYGHLNGSESAAAAFSGYGDVDGGGSFQAAGSFVDSSSKTAAGVIGNFSAETSSGSWKAVGVFGGSYSGSVPTPDTE